MMSNMSKIPLCLVNMYQNASNIITLILFIYFFLYYHKLVTKQFSISENPQKMFNVYMFLTYY